MSLTICLCLVQVVVGPQRPDGFDHAHDELHVTVDLLALPAELEEPTVNIHSEKINVSITVQQHRLPDLTSSGSG